MATTAPAAFRPASNRAIRALFFGAGSALVGIGVLGIFLPLLPSTVFFLLAAPCYGKSSPAAHRWLMTNRLFGSQLRDYQQHHGATTRTKVVSIASLWLGLAVGAYFVPVLWVDAILVVIGAAVTFHIVRLRTIRS